MKKRILYIYPESSTFIRKDIGFLSRHYRVITPGHDWKNKSLTPLNFLKQFLFLCRNLPGSKAVFVMFGGYWSFLPALAGKITRIHVYIIPGGTDCVSFPSMGYGSLRKPVMRTFIKWSFSLCTELLPVDESLANSAYTYLPDSDYPRQGFRFFFPRLKTPYRVINNGFDPGFFNSDPDIKKENSFIAVAPVNNLMRVRVKGIDTVIMLARKFSDCSFTIVGLSDEVAAKLGPLPENIKIYPFMPQQQFMGLLAESRYVLQLSVSEGFPNALCEAMLCHCIPVGSSVGSVPSIIGDSGYVMDSPDPEYLTARMDEILGADADTRRRMGLMARERIASLFHISIREKAFLDLLEPSGQQ